MNIRTILIINTFNEFININSMMIRLLIIILMQNDEELRRYSDLMIGTVILLIATNPTLCFD